MLKNYPKSKMWVQTSHSSTSSSPGTPTTSRTLVPCDGSVDGTDNPRWRQQVLACVQAGTTLTGISRKLILRDGVYAWYQFWDAGKQWTAFRATGNIAGIPDDPSGSLLPLTTANARALTELAKVLDNNRRMVDSITVLGEMSKTIHMIRNPAKALRRGLDKYHSSVKKRMRNTKPGRRQHVAAETWLEYAFGWVPLFNDLHDIGKVLETEKRQRFLTRKRLRATGLDESVTITTRASGGGGLNVVRVYNTLRKQNSVRYIACHETKAEGLLERNLEIAGFDPLSFVPQVWELIPYSFLVDYFTNLGEIISAASYGRSGVRWVIKGTEQKASNHLHGQHVQWSTVLNNGWRWIYNTLQSGESFREYRKVVRVPYSDTLVPPLVFEVPAPDSLKWLNIAALAALRT